MNKRFGKEFYAKDALEVAPLLLGQLLVRRFPEGSIKKYVITETEVYKGKEDTASHARFAKTKRNKQMYKEGGISYIYLCYGIHHLFNIVTGLEGEAQAVLIRGVKGLEGPGKLTKELNIDKTLNDINLSTSKDLWIEKTKRNVEYKTSSRIGIDYASEPYRSIEWRFILKD